MKKNIKLSILTLMIFILFTSCKNSSANEASNLEVSNLNAKQSNSLSYPIVDTGQTKSYDNYSEIKKPSKGDEFYGQDSNYSAYQAKYIDNGDGTISDLVTGLMWQKSPGEKVAFEDAITNVNKINTGAYSDWRLPTIKELYSLILFSGKDIGLGSRSKNSSPFIDTDYFEFEYGDESNGERAIDSQYWSSTEYVSTTMGGAETVFGVNFADGRIKGYPKIMRNEDKKMYALYVRGNESYGENDFLSNNDGTVSDKATGLMWMQSDSDKAMSWEEALKWAENAKLAGYSDWRLPNAKELQSIVDYSKSPATTNSPAINDIFECSEIKDEGGDTNYPFYWTGTTHVNNGKNTGGYAVYIAFGEALGYMGGNMQQSQGSRPEQGMDRAMLGKRPPMRREQNSNRVGRRMMPPQNNNKMSMQQSGMNSNKTLMDVHGAGAQRSDPKVGSASDYPTGHGPQGDVIRIKNYVRLVRDI